MKYSVKWEEIKPKDICPFTPRTDFGAELLDGKVYLFGG
jgi:hypothetical protein